MYDPYYQNKLYPLQDKILALIAKLPVAFYLTGGTALSRAYLNHRYSDDLDFFANALPEFKIQVNIILDSFSREKINFERGTFSGNFVRVIVQGSDIPVKIDFVNDVAYHYGPIQATNVYYRTDNPLNILANKLSALPRNEARDLADLLYLCRGYKFEWEEMISIAQKKDAWVDPIKISQIVANFHISEMRSLKWIKKPAYDRIKSDLKRIAEDLLKGGENSVAER